MKTYQYWYEKSESDPLYVRDTVLYRNELDGNGCVLGTEALPLGRTQNKWVRQTWTFASPNHLLYKHPKFVYSFEELIADILLSADAEYEEQREELKSNYDYYREAIKDLI